MQDDPTLKTEPHTSWREKLRLEPPFDDLFLNWEEGETYFLELARVAGAEPRAQCQTIYHEMSRRLRQLAFDANYIGTPERMCARHFILELMHRTEVALIPALADQALPHALARAAIAVRRFRASA
jgi:hypothetical protein